MRVSLLTTRWTLYPYMGPNWYWRQNADTIIAVGFANACKIGHQHVLYTLTASEHAPANALVEPYRKLKTLCGKLWKAA